MIIKKHVFISVDSLMLTFHKYEMHQWITLVIPQV